MTGALLVTGRAWRVGDEPGRRQFVTFDREFALEAGGTLPSVTVAYETWGTLAPDASNAVLVRTRSPSTVTRPGPRNRATCTPVGGTG